jgi:chemotaxis response regulator CheB
MGASHTHPYEPAPGNGAPFIPAAALIYQHMTSDRDRTIADRLGAMIRVSVEESSGSSESEASK